VKRNSSDKKPASKLAGPDPVRRYFSIAQGPKG
jgi:hypothetical protein